MFKYLIILTLSFLAPFTVFGDDGKEPVLIKGNIIDQVSGKVITGAVITIEQNGQIIQSIQSDEEGNFSLKYEEGTLRIDQLKVSIYKSGYRLKKVKTIRETDNDMKIELEKKPKFIPILLPTGPDLNFSI